MLSFVAAVILQMLFPCVIDQIFTTLLDYYSMTQTMNKSLVDLRY
jgi:hypothetical protein